MRILALKNLFSILGMKFCAVIKVDTMSHMKHRKSVVSHAFSRNAKFLLFQF